MSSFAMAVVLLGTAADADAADRLQFNRDIRPILSGKCFKCHGPDSAARKADLRLDVRNIALPLLGPDDPQTSEFLWRIGSTDSDVLMPPPASNKTLSQKEIQTLRTWISQGAEYEAHWAFLPPQRPTLPRISNSAWPKNGIDYFILEKLDQQSLGPSPEASRETLIRRVTLDLTGLPPTPAEVDEFLADDSPKAYETLVDRLLESPRYGETMAADWLDASRYADTDGYQNDRYRYMSPWRDWVIGAFNRNMPFDQFTIEQLAGDMLPGATLEQQIATGFCRNHRINSEGGSIPEEWAVEYVADRVETMGTIWLGITLNCARCHDHKFDPVSQNEFYQLYAYFNSVPEWGLGPNNGNSPPFVGVPESWPTLSAEQNHLIPPAPYEIVKTQTSVLRPKPGGPETVMVMQEMETPRPTYRLIRGRYNQPDTSGVLARNVPRSLTMPEVDPPQNRLELAQWLVHPNQPLTSRVTVNRFWQKYFETGLVRTSENLGSQGESPSHPELLDWLATEFIRLGWDIKRMQKLIVTSAAYRQSSKTSTRLRAIDPENRLLSRGPRHRLSAFTLRDQALFASGLLVEKIGGPSVKPYMPPNIWRAYSNNKYVQDHGDKLYRRSVYTYWRRTIPPPTMANFNASDRENCTVRKEKTNTPLQALTMMNNITFVEASRFLAERMMKEGGPALESRLIRGFRLASGRHPSRHELGILAEAYSRYFKRFQDDSAAAADFLEVGEKPRDRSLDASEQAAFAMVASTLLNLDEVISEE